VKPVELQGWGQCEEARNTGQFTRRRGELSNIKRAGGEEAVGIRQIARLRNRLPDLQPTTAAISSRLPVAMLEEGLTAHAVLDTRHGISVMIGRRRKAP
jgi:hypothetical protein